jgi:anti-sigma factor RsiW
MSTSNLHLSDDELVLHYYGEMERADEARAGAHLEACHACRENYGRLQRVMAFVDSAPAVDAPDGFERIAWARLEPALRRERHGWFRSVLLTPAYVAFAAGVLVLVGAAFIAGRMMPKAPVATAAAGTAAEQVRERILLVDLGEHLDRSQMVLVELVSADDKGSVDISSERARAEQLVAANRLYRQTAVSTGDAATASVLDDLERVLVDIAASPSTMSQADLDSVRRRIESKELLFKVRVISTQVREREKADVAQARRVTVGS